MSGLLELLKSIPAELNAVCITTLGSLLIAAIAYVRTKKLKFFETFLEKKSSAYAQYIKCAMRYLASTNPDSDNITVELYAAFYEAKLYCSKTAFLALDGLFSVVKSDSIEPRALTDKLDETIRIFRNDIQQCRKYKFE